MRCFRLVDEDYLEAAFSGEGARLYGGRWNSPGVAVVYTAQSLSLAQLELLVHLEAEAVLRGHWRYFAVDVAPRVI
nr:RES domain-containing protein [Chromatiaceae bacterium]